MFFSCWYITALKNKNQQVRSSHSFIKHAYSPAGRLLFEKKKNESLSPEVEPWIRRKVQPRGFYNLEAKLPNQ
ncbi:MAG: hypothetical protein A2836_01115 [Candidatus Taylorbacteria bacterium RIFCSPHIGHO2_01_FULL_45_63]|uniref:Uncharacterized protein n=1 Tax=Candidatus Taylorbacteria bacterium RIFCSPHIGHO2_02_FULL_45_35 TaxID=1802311 RepID=A0A1G2MWY9_9BACT|nr:MAG: hypothetical protein A2836_01115 [Candidatus Taylorbacteria bacterium RIFCSPHIGHO2_01_FULL_45_63]OHA27562.1 MAG: hypothetical protein A3D56_02840 [Candidatus Taylorbacteria bacterium RIFCSPHIGHO2_02_FULL_45_35]OHA34693.1 MAG: hypothetical protein A3A22_00885 [Candidatus Taylorbacteria bacterium RIFCSPLOWO2_01_FULL_45_34b]